MTTAQLSYPPNIKKQLRYPVWGHQRKGQLNLYQGKRNTRMIQSCFSEKKSIRPKRINSYKKILKSQLLGVNLRVWTSSKALRTIRKYGGIDNYLTCMDPKKLDSQFGDYLSTLMLRKVENPDMPVPHILRTKPLPKMTAKLYKYFNRPGLDDYNSFGRYETKQIPFGTLVEEYDQETYAKYMEMEKVKRSYQDMETNHPLVLELEKKTKQQEEVEAEVDRLAQEARDEYLNISKFKRLKLQDFQEEEQHRKEYMDLIAQDMFKNPELKE